jgi:PPK2 family polyphosphate:nucleotide phosphotransferase
LKITDYRIHPGKKSKLTEIETDGDGGFDDKDEGAASLERDAEAIDDWQEKLFAEGKRALLVVLQGTDTSGKDGSIRKVFAHTSPLGVSVTGFGKPTDEELDHDFLWRIHNACPRRGRIGIFNRSHYEDVLIGRVLELAPHDEIELRYGQINDFEKMLTENGTTVLKIMLHLSKAEQRERLHARLEDPDKRWKFNPADLDKRDQWDAYQAAYELMLDRCSTEWAPWYVVPADRKWARNAIIARLVRETLEEMDPEPHRPDYGLGDFTIE